ncbi:MAG: hypothetical protein PHU77_11800, partial [Simplicispira sp.]|nr:hypothetical protein [Simplicispira sp.]
IATCAHQGCIAGRLNQKINDAPQSSSATAAAGLTKFSRWLKATESPMNLTQIKICAHTGGVQLQQIL